jgi:hypothetical protein
MAVGIAGNQIVALGVSAGMDASAEHARTAPPARIRLDSGAWWAMVVAAVLVVVILLGPVVVLALGDHLDREVKSVPHTTEPGPTP